MEARAHPTQALGLLKSMLQNLDAAAATDPNYDKAGPSRVRALVLIRAPGWPLGPGDTDAGLRPRGRLCHCSLTILLMRWHLPRRCRRPVMLKARTRATSTRSI